MIRLKEEWLLKKEQGLFILIVIVIVAVLTSVSLLGMRNTLHSTKLAAGFIHYAQAFQQAELALAIAQRELATSRKYEVMSSNKPIVLGAYPQLVSFNGNEMPAWQYIEQKGLWRNSDYSVAQYDNSGKIMNTYIIEKLLIIEASTSANYYRVTAKGWGRDTRTSVVLQSFFKHHTSIDRLAWQIIQ